MIAMAMNGATASEIAAKFKTSVKTIERKAKALGISIGSGGARQNKFPARKSACPRPQRARIIMAPAVC